MRAENSHRKRRGWCALKYSAIMMGLVSSFAAASVPIEQSRPIGVANPMGVTSPIDVANAPINSAQDNVEKAVEKAEAPSVFPADSDSSTAYLLNTIEQMRQELMELRGQLEEQGFQLERLQQENRDRYLDLDERISRLNQNGGKTVASGSRSPSATTSVKKTTGKGGSSSKVSDKEALKGEEEAYQAAFGLIRGKQFDQAREALKKQLAVYPEGRYADNAQYWLGEVEMAQGQYQPARDAFQSVLNDYPGSPKVPDASYKLGRLHDLLGDKDKARSLLESVIKKYPDTAAARLSDTYLRVMDGS